MTIRINKTLRKKGVHQMPKTMAHITPAIPIKMTKPITMGQHEDALRGVKLPKVKTIKLSYP